MMEIDNMPGDSRVWIYQADRFLTVDEVAAIRAKLSGFIDQWSSHGRQMAASAEVYLNRLIVIAADEAAASASGCGIDKSVNCIREIQAATGIDFFQRTQVLFRKDGRLLEAPIHQFWAMRKAGIIDDQTIIIDNTVKLLADLRAGWEVPFSQSWHAEMWQR